MAVTASRVDLNSGEGISNSKYIFDRILPDCYLYISHLDEEYQYWQLPGYPDEVSDQMVSRFTPTTALGRSAPVYTFSDAGPRAVQISLNFHRHL